MDSDMFDEALNLESKFYTQGYEEGAAHGRLHGVFEGRQLGQEKAWEVWEEIGFYEGFARVWGVKLAAGVSRRDAKALNHVKLLLELVEGFPVDNPSQGAKPAWPPRSSEEEEEEEEEDDGADLAQMLSSIRARYRLLCTSVGVRPRLVAIAKDGRDAPTAAPVEGIEGPMKGVDTRQLRF